VALLTPYWPLKQSAPHSFASLVYSLNSGNPEDGSQEVGYGND